jgi:hypothetical protein
MKSIMLQLGGLLLILLSTGLLWMLDLYGASFNTSGSSRILPRLTMEYVMFLSFPAAIGTALIIYGRRLR